ncbi:hypothetical protein VTK56DRAFT_75 [Thermocarpiscus australiensis]
MDIPKGGKSPSSKAILPLDAREKSASGTQSTLPNQQHLTPTSKMTYARRLVLVTSLCLLVLLGVASASSPRLLGARCHKGTTPDHQTSADAPAESPPFSALLNSASPASIHELLRRYFPDRFRDGVWESEHQAIKAVHQEDAALATSILQLAKRDNSTSSVSPTDSSTPPVDTSTSAASTGDSSPSPTSATSAPSSTSQSVVTQTSASSPPPPGTSSSPRETASSPISSSSGPETSSSARTSASSAPQTPPSSSIDGDTTLTTSTVVDATSSTSSTSKEVVQTFTSTRPNGAVVTITTTTFVPANPGETSAPTSTRPAASLQSSATQRHYAGSLLAGVLGVTMLLVLA